MPVLSPLTDIFKNKMYFIVRVLFRLNNLLAKLLIAIADINLHR